MELSLDEKRYFWTSTFFLRYLAATKTPGAHSSLVFNPCGQPIYCCFNLKIFRIFSKKKLLLLPQMSDILWHQRSSKDTRYLLSRILVQWTLSTFFLTWFPPEFLLVLNEDSRAGREGRGEGSIFIKYFSELVWELPAKCEALEWLMWKCYDMLPSHNYNFIM